MPSATPSQWVRYCYYLRFAFALWVFPFAMACLNMTGLRTLTSGILVSEEWQQITCVAFFIVSTGFIALIIARGIVVNGEERFNLSGDQEQTVPLEGWLRDDQSQREGKTLCISLLPAGLTFGYLLVNNTAECVPLSKTILGLVTGTLLAASFWYAINVFYYLFHRLPSHADMEVANRQRLTEQKTPVDARLVNLGWNAARTILFPRRAFRLPAPGEALDLGTIEAADVPARDWWSSRVLAALFSRIVQFNSLPGFVSPGTANLYEAPFFSLVALMGFLVLFVVMWPLTAPVPSNLSPLMLSLLLGGGVLCATIFGTATVAVPAARSFGFIKHLSWMLVLAFTFSFPVLYLCADGERFPTFALLLIAATLLLWALAAIGFFLDRYRVPVVTALILWVVIPRLTGLDLGREEHYLSVTENSAPAQEQTPAEILNRWLPNATDPEMAPVIVITATGGGLHASAWTAAVLTQLETRFKQEHQSMYPRVLLLSTVSGGSVGALSYLDAAKRGDAGGEAANASASCSSLEAVGWGLIYHDLPSTFLGPPFWLFGSSSGINDLDDSPLMKDRTWALRKGFERNLRDDYCGKVYEGSAKKVKEKTVNLQAIQQTAGEAAALRTDLTTRSFAVKPGDAPAVVMNTTTAEKGDRFLLSNYDIPAYPLGPGQALPAQSFLGRFGKTDISNCDCGFRYPDLPLATAAQLSATFPYISSAARFPYKRNASEHFIDGGYYDNDGTASVLEFLRYALDGYDASESGDLHPGNHAALAAVRTKLAGRPLRVILIEIRNSDDDPADKDRAQLDSESDLKPRSMLYQVLAPLSGFWHAGHTSVTARNRAALGLIEEAYQDRLQIHHIVIADKHSEVGVGTDPLNWSLTPRQRKEVQNSATADDLKGLYAEAVQWMNASPAEWVKPVTPR